MRQSVCSKCGRSCALGYDAVGNYAKNTVTCDACAGVERDRNGYAWHPGQTEKTYVDLDGNNPITVTREEAFKR